MLLALETLETTETLETAEMLETLETIKTILKSDMPARSMGARTVQERLEKCS